MAEEKKNEDFVNVTDCLETIGVCKSMKNLLFIIMFLAIVLLGLSFWLADLGIVKFQDTPDSVENRNIVDVPLPEQDKPEPNSVASAVAKAVEKVTEDTNVIVVEDLEQAETQDNEMGLPADFKIDYAYLAKIIQISNFVLVLAAALYALTLLLCLKVSLVGRLGGMSHITKAFFGSLFLLVFIFPWQKYLGPVTIGAIYLPEELKQAVLNKENVSVVENILYYMRFVLWWLVVLILLFVTQRRTAKWANSTLRRLGIE